MDLNKIGRPLFGSVFARIFGVDELNAVSTLAPEVLPVTSPWERPEFWALLGGSLGTARLNQSAVAANFSSAGIVNPNGSGVLVIVERVLRILPVAGAFVDYGTLRSQQALTSIVSSFDHRDLRRASATVAAGLGARPVIGAHVGAAYNITGAIPVEAAGWTPLDVILAPGQSWGCTTRAMNTELEIAVQWRERPVMPDELEL